MNREFRTRSERDAIAMQAALWMQRLEESSDSGTQAAFEAWVAMDPAHGVAFVEAEQAIELASRVRTADSLVADAENYHTSWHSALMTRRAFAGAALAASVGGAIYLGVRPLLSSETIETARGERTQQQLGDGSSIALNTDSKVEVALGKGERHVKLLRGEVFFDVKRDPDRPFVVDLGDGRVEVLGTSFNILKKDDMIEVTVSEGVVAVTGFDGAVTQVKAGKTALIGQGLLTTSATSKALARQRRAWNEGFIELNDEPLAMAVAEVNRYRTVPLVIGDPSIASLSVSGRFGVDESDSFIDALKTSFHLKTVRTQTGAIVLMRAGDNLPVD